MQLDDDGNRTTIADGQPTPTTLVNLTFDYTNRLQSYAEVGGDTTQYRYDPFGRRIQKIGAGATTLYLWDGDQLLGEYTASGDRKVRYAYAGGFAPVQVAYDDGMGGEAIYEVHTDHLDTPKLSTDDTGAVVWRAAHEAYGSAVLDPGNSLAESFNIRFPGQYYDAETGLHYNRFRYYDPGIGRYASADPIGQFGLLGVRGVDTAGVLWSVDIAISSGLLPVTVGPHRYVYVRNQPVFLIDPLGLGPYTDLLIEGGLVVTCTVAGCFLGGPPGCGAGAFVGGGAALIYEAYGAAESAEEIAAPIGEGMQRYYDRNYSYPDSSPKPNLSQEPNSSQEPDTSSIPAEDQSCDPCQDQPGG